MKILKKRFPFLLLALFIAVLPVMLAVPAHAADLYPINGIWVFNESIEKPLYSFSGSGFEPGSMSALTTDGSVVTYFDSNNTWFSMMIDGDWVNVFAFGFSVTQLGEPKYRTLDFGDTPIYVSEWAYNWFISNSVPLECGGYSCSSTDANKDNICDDCNLPFVVPRYYPPPDPFTVKKFMNNVGQIVTSAVSWVGNVGSTILQQPLLLAFTALPLCGLGIAVFRRLKETV